MVTVFVIALVFQDWDECWDFYHANKDLLDQSQWLETCEQYEYPEVEDE